MKKLDTMAFTQIDRWMARNARPLEWALWRLHFHKGSREDVLCALGAYQNGDGGFGYALEADNWNPESMPYVTLCAVNLLRSIGMTDAAQPLLAGALRFFEHTQYRSDFGWHFNIPSSNGHARAPWWGYGDDGPSAIQSLGLTAEVAGFALRFTAPDSPLYDTALSYADQTIATLFSDGTYDDMGIGGAVAMMDDLEAAGLGSRFVLPTLRVRLKELVDRSIVRDPDEWQYYGVRPSNYIHSPDSPWLPGNEDIIEAELDYLVDTLPQGGIWDVPWSWFDHNERYAREWAISENWWRAFKGIEKVQLLQAFGRIDL